MGEVQLILIAVGLAMDASAVSICKGLQMKKIDYKYSLMAASFFGGFQALMPLIGWMIGRQFESYIVSVDHWIAFGLLLFIGGKMLLESRKITDEYCPVAYDIKELFVLAVATSIDALAVGITLAFLHVNIVSAVTVIGIVTFALSLAGVFIGNAFGMKYKTKAEFAGGLILILIGFRILLDHLGFLN